MQRHTALVPLSHDHQRALARALRLRKASELDGAERREGAIAFVEFADEYLAPHFVEEEALLDRAVAASDDPQVEDHRARLREEHAALTERVEQLRAACSAPGELDAALMFETGQRLSDHVRYEERELFELLQETFGDELPVIAAHDGHG